jgi:AcrR family transcriptional regulator
MAVGQVNANDPRVKRTRKLLQQTLFDLMQEKSFDAITVQDIAERSTLNRATFYAHFEDKYDLLDSSMREWFEQALTGAVSDSTAVDADNLRAICRAVFDFFAQIEEHCRPHYRQFDPMLERAVQDVLQAFLVRWLQRRTPAALPAGVGVETVAAVLSWTIFGLGSQWSRGLRTQSSDEVAAQIVAVLTNGLTELIAP